MTEIYAEGPGGFYFTSFEQYIEEKSKMPLEGLIGTYTFIEGDDEELFEALCNKGDAGLEAFFNISEQENYITIIKCCFLLSIGVDLSPDLDDLVDKSSEVSFIEKVDLEEWLREYLVVIPTHLTNYINLDAVKNDLTCEGSLVEVTEGYITNACYI